MWFDSWMGCLTLLMTMLWQEESPSYLNGCEMWTWGIEEVLWEKRWVIYLPDQNVYILFSKYISINWLKCSQHIVLHPAYKTEHFPSNGWPEGWITTMVDLLWADWTKTYKPAVGNSDGSVGGNNMVQSGDVCHFIVYIHDAYIVFQNLLRTKYFGSIMHLSSQTLDTLSAYLAAPTIPSIQEPLGYWQVMDGIKQWSTCTNVPCLPFHTW